MLESVHCPTCSTHYGLKASRVQAGHRRARCFRCATVFGIEQEVLRLTGTPAPLAEPLGIGPEDLLPPTAPAAPAVEAEATPSLTLGDLEGIEEEILEKTLVTEAPVSHPEAVQAGPEEAIDLAGGYSSAKDAIAKLLGNVPTPDVQQERRSLNRAASQMDVEATLDALETTLGGVGAKELETRPVIPPPELTQAELEPVQPMASTMKLTHDEIVSAMRAAAIPAAAPRPAPKAPVPPPVPVREAAPAPEPDPSLLKLQVGQEVYNNVSMDQITTWIEQGRVQDFHMVARQFSENWIEAGKVPSLRLIFERVRRQQAPAAQQAQAVILPPASETAPIKKSLFGGLFNRG